MSDSIEAQVSRVVADVMQIPLTGVTPATGPATVAGWDSVQHLNLVLALEQQFGISFDPEEIEKLQSVQAIASMVAAKK